MLTQVLQGSILSENVPPRPANAAVRVGGTVCGRPAELLLDEQMLSRHMLLIGGTGSGKTNAFFHFIRQLKGGMGQDDIAIVFDTKGDYLSEFFREGDCVISAAGSGEPGVRVWNIFREILADGYATDKSAPNITEVSWGLFAETIERNNSNPFFPAAARDLFSALLTGLVRCTCGEPFSMRKLTNLFLRRKLDSLTAQAVGEIIGDYDDLRAVMSYIGDGMNPQGLGVLAEMQTVLRQVLDGGFAQEGDFSVREFVRARGGRTLFIEYDIARGAALTPVYKLLIDLALKEAMSRGGRGNVYVFCDEFKLLPHLQHIEDAVNFGRSLGVKVFAGLQSIDQLYENYGEARGKNIAAGFSSVFSFRANDEDTRNFTSGLYGKNYVLEQYATMACPMGEEEKRIGNVVEDWDIAGLAVGEAIVGLSGAKPFRFQFDLYRG